MPDEPVLLYHLGIARRQQGRHDEALALVGRAAALDPKKAEIHYVLGNCLLALERYDDAAASFRSALAISPAFPDACNNLGIALVGCGQIDEGLAAYRRALELRPGFPGAIYNIGKALARQNQHREAIVHYRRVAGSTLPSAEVRFDLGRAYAALAEWESAVASYRHVVKVDPKHAAGHHALGVAELNLHRMAEAVASFRKAVAIEPSNGGFLTSLGHALLLGRALGEASSVLREAVALQPKNATAPLLLAEALTRSGSFDAALTVIGQALQLQPDAAELHFMAGLIQLQRRNTSLAVAALRHTLELDPEHASAADELLHQLQSTLDWAEAERLAPVVRAATDRALAAGRGCAEKPLESLVRNADPRRNLAVAAAHAKQLATPRPLAQPGRRGKAAASRKIRLGYLSVDFGTHPVSQAIGPVLSRHDRERFIVMAYSYGPDDGSQWRRRIEAGADRFIDLRDLTDEDAARRIHDDGVDILIDLTVWTANARLEIAARRPAPLQLQYLGFPGTSGSAIFDYAIVDSVVVPPENRDFWSERLLFMPRCYFPADRDQQTTATGLRRSDCGLPEDGIVLCSFNQGFKIDRRVFAAWMRLLRELPGAVLWLSQVNPEAQERLRREAGGQGVAPARLIFAPRVDEKSRHIERLALSDVALDPFAYNGHMTTVDALLAGVPVVTMLGTHFPSRVSASMLKAVGLDELIAGDAEAYVQLALRLGRDPNYRARLRERLDLARRSAPFFDPAQSAADLERLYESIWRRFLAGDAPADIAL
jgi:predicted O-linked N-acetylglucosamine transferase (SPINDLY family)